VTRRALQAVAVAAVGWAVLSPRPLSSARPAARAQQTASSLTAGTVLDRTIRGGERQTFAIELAAGDFVYVVIDHRRAHDFASIVDGFETLLDERLGFVAAEVRSATPLTDAQRATLETQVSRLAGEKARLKFSSDPALMGGVVAHVGSTVYDGSVRGQLEKLRTRLGAN